MVLYLVYGRWLVPTAVQFGGPYSGPIVGTVDMLSFSGPLEE